MPQNRPRIPAEIERQVLIEARHRCAVCGAERPLEFAHIIPWHRSQNHSAENLVCLCANCHQRADNEKWGKETLRRYKQEPWVVQARIGERGNAFASLHQLPPPPADFTGREAELAELRAAVQNGGVTISGVRGMGGIGKTALALKLAQELTPDYSDAQIYLDLQGVSTNPVSPAQAMAHVIRAFHPDAKLPESEGDLVGLYRSVLYGKRAFLLMDNVADRAQVESLVPPADCLLLVTSRTRFHLPGLQEKNLGKMRPEDARDLLLRIAPRIGDEAGRIAEICAGLPFAIRQAAGTLSERPDLSPARYTDRLAEEKGKLGLVKGTLSLSYDLLSEELACRWRLLAVFPTSFDAVAAATIWAVEQDEADTALGDLVRRNLVDGEDGRYRLHDLARVFASNRATDEERVAAERGHSMYYRDVLAQAAKLYMQGGLSLLIGLQLVDREWPNIQAGQSWSAARIKDRESAVLAASFSYVSADLLNLRLRPQEWMSWLKTALEGTRLSGDRGQEVAATINLGVAYADLGEIRRATEFYQQGLIIAREIRHREGEAGAMINLGVAYGNLGEARSAIEFYDQGLAILREISDRRGEANAIGNLGRAYAALGELHRAIDLFEQELAITREIGDRRGEANATGDQGRAYAALGEPHRAIEFFEQELAISRELGDRRGEAIASSDLGGAYGTLGETQKASELYGQALTIAREIGDRSKEASVCWNLGLVLEKQGDLERAEELMQVRVDYEREIGHPEAEEHADRVAVLRARLKAELDPFFVPDPFLES